MASFNFDMTNTTWYNLPEYCQLELINTLGSWSKKVAQNIGKFYGFEIGKDIVVTSVKVGLKVIKVK